MATVARNQLVWSDAEYEYLRNRFLEDSLEDIAQVLGRSVKSVVHAHTRLGLKRQDVKLHQRSKEYALKDGYVLVPLRTAEDKRFWAKADIADLDFLVKYLWHVMSTGYAARSTNAASKAGAALMHRVLLDAPREAEVDHINGNPLDNRRANLRLCSRQQNSRNRHSRFGASPYVGVARERKKWFAYINCDGVRTRLGVFHSEAEAALAYNKAAIKLFGEFANLNVIK